MKTIIKNKEYDNKQVYGSTNEHSGFFRLQQYQIISHTHTQPINNNVKICNNLLYVFVKKKNYIYIYYIS